MTNCPEKELVLVRPWLQTSSEKHWAKMAPLGMGYLASSCISQGIGTAVVDAKLEGYTSLNQTPDAIKMYNPRYVGISAATVEFSSAIRLSTALRRWNKDIKVVLGGVHVNALPRESLEQATDADYVISGEAELELPGLLSNGNDPAQIKGIFWRLGDAVIEGPPRSLMEDITGLPFPAWHLFPKMKTYSIITERGCPYDCVFCSQNMGRKLRTRPVEQVVEEIKWLIKDFNPEEIWFQDETFGINQDRAAEILGRVAEINSGRGIRFHAQTRVDRVSSDFTGSMKKAGIEYLELGVESGDRKVLENSKKAIEISKVREAVSFARRDGLKIWLKFIIGLPGENEASVRKSIDLATELNPDRLSISTIVAYPGSRIFEWAKSGKNGYRLTCDDWNKFDKYLSNSLELENLSTKKMRQLQLRMYLEVYIRNGRIRELARLVLGNLSLSFKLLQNSFRK